MKKLFAMIAIAGALVACNNASESTEGADTTTIITDTMTAPVDTTLSADTAMSSVDTTAHVSADTTQK